MDVAAWKTINRLVGEALMLPPSERTTWVDQLDAEYEAFKPRLRAMLDAADSTGYAAFLDTLPKLDGEVGATVELPGAHQAGGRIGPYRLVREIASGGQGSVWVAERVDGALQRTVAVKLPIGLGYRPGLAARMARERDILARLEHPNIARLYDAGLSREGEPYLALEYVDGIAIDRYVQARDLGIDGILRLALQVMGAVAYAHGLLVIHRDLKPSNILVTPDGQVRLLDFGIASLLEDDVAPDSTATLEGGRALTLPYASPEQVQRRPLGVGTDVYSLGVVLYELLTGVRPHRPARETVAALEDAILSGHVARPSDAASTAKRRAGLRGDVDTILLKALRTAPEARYATVSAFADDLERHIDGLPVLAQPDSRGYRLGKFLKRHRVAASAAAGVSLAVLVGAGVAVWQARAARAAQGRAETIATFITSMLRDIDPNLRGQGRPFTAEDVLGFARDRLAADLSVATDVRAELLAVLGEGYSGVGDPAAAVPVLDKAVDQATAAWGAEATQTLDARVHRVLAMQYVNRGEEALAEIAGIIEILARTGRLNSPVHAAALEARVEVLLNGGKAITDEAEAAGLEALAVAERAGSGNEPSVAQAHRSLAVIFRTRSKHEQAIEHAALGYRLTGDLRGHDPWHPQVILAQNEYGRCLFQAGRTADSVAELQSAADYGQRTFRDNPIVLQHLLGTLANVQLAYGDLKGGIANLDASARLDMRGITLSPVYVASQHVVRARAFLAARQLDDAVTEFDRALAIAATTPDVNLVATLQTERAEALVRLGRDEEARRALDRIATGRGPNPSPAARRAVWLLGEIERRQGHDRDALALFREAASGPAATGRSKIDKGFFQLSMGFSLLALGEPEEARPVLDEARAALSAGAGKTTPAVANALVALGRAHLATGDNAAALPLLTEADLFWRDFAPRSTDAADAARWLAAARTSRLLTR